MSGIEFLTGGVNVAALTNAVNTSLDAFIAESERQFISFLINKGHSESYARVQWVVCGGVANATWAFNLNQREQAKVNAMAQVGCEEHFQSNL